MDSKIEEKVEELEVTVNLITYSFYLDLSHALLCVPYHDMVKALQINK